ncbi:CUB domain-containing protein 2 Precursor [Channa argus]|uniref:CUB domain-containing protein 2 n=1 Tax=Channa argus TaxID=215402 RepID=A0A6G1Q7W4_CHAAH|nr:CUB domain-containing protein 2 Precursor [Channa argus]
MSLRVAILIHLLLVVDKAESKKDVKCGGILSSPSGNISSPNFPGLYPYNIDCSWLIVVADGSSVLLTFHHFELEYHASCAYDYIKIYNGISEDEGNLLGTFCGDISPPQFTSSWNVMSIIFHSDRHVAHRGFSVGYRKDMCGGVLTGLSGVISSPGYPQEYSNNADCSWSIHVSNTSVVTFVFLDFQLENNEGCNFDFVALFDGPTVTHRHLGKYCGTDKPSYIVTTSNQLLVVFKSDFNIGGRGFKAYYYSGECQQVLSAICGNFSSPNFPNIYPNNINCHWSITLAAGYRIKLFFPTMDLEDRNGLSDECDYDSVAVYDGDSQTDTLLGRWCGREQPSVLISKRNKLLVVLSTDRNQARRGFTASYLGECFVPINSVTPAALQKHHNITMLVNRLYIDFSNGKQQNVQEYKVQCDALRKIASVSLISAEERRLEEQAHQTDNDSRGIAWEEEAEPHDLSDIVFISICVLAVILMVIAIIWLVLL